MSDAAEDPWSVPRLPLLGSGMDAILWPTRQRPRAWEWLFYSDGIDTPALPALPTPEKRLARYYDALNTVAPPGQLLWEARALLGMQFKQRLVQIGRRSAGRLHVLRSVAK